LPSPSEGQTGLDSRFVHRKPARAPGSRSPSPKTRLVAQLHWRQHEIATSFRERKTVPARKRGVISSLYAINNRFPRCQPAPGIARSVRRAASPRPMTSSGPAGGRRRGHQELPTCLERIQLLQRSANRRSFFSAHDMPNLGRHRETGPAA